MADYNVDTLENKIVVEAKDAVSEMKSVLEVLNQIKTAVDSISNSKLDKQITTSKSKYEEWFKSASKYTSAFKKALNFTGLVYTAKKAYGYVTDAIQNSIDYSETLNLFEVSLGKKVDQYGELDKASSQYYMKALKFQNQLNEAFGTNKEETMRYQALFNQMSKSMGINEDASYFLSENFTRLGIDLASLYNIKESDAMQKLRAGLAGQTKPLRDLGLDITQQSLSPILQEIGIDRTVKQLSQAEKMILRYIAVVKQASSAHGDFANTIESPANQLRVLRNQIEELKTSAGSLLQGLYGQILPYVNGIVMVIKEVIKAIGAMCGVDVKSSNTSAGISDLADDLEDASDSATKLKNQLLKFDEINNIDTSANGSSLSSISGIDKRLLDEMKKYEDSMKNVEMEATKIRDSIMEWLGFTKIIDEETGEVSFKLNEGWTNLEKIKDSAIAIGGTLLGWKLGSIVSDIALAKSDLKGFAKFAQSLKIKAGITITIVGVTLYAEGLAGVSDGEIEGKDLALIAGGALATGAGVALAGGGLTIGIPVALTLIGISIGFFSEQKYGNIVDFISDRIGIPRGQGHTISISLGALDLGFQTVELIGLGPQLKKSFKAVLLEIADWLRNVPFIGQEIYDGITKVISGTEFITGIEQSTTASVGGALRTSSYKVNSLSAQYGENTGEKIREGIKSKNSDIQSTISNTLSTSIANSSGITRESARNLGILTSESLESAIDGTESAKKLVNPISNSLSELPNIASREMQSTVQRIRQESNGALPEIQRISSDIKNAISKDLNGNFKINFDAKVDFSKMKNTLKLLKRTMETMSRLPLMGKVFSNMLPSINSMLSLLEINQFANGGFPQVGNLFFANESGPELVGKIGNKTAVANNGQIVESLKAGVYDAMIQAMPQAGATNVTLDIRADEGIIVKKASEGFNEYVKQTGELPFVVPAT